MLTFTGSSWRVLCFLRILHVLGCPEPVVYRSIFLHADLRRDKLNFRRSNCRLVFSWSCYLLLCSFAVLLLSFSMAPVEGGVRSHVFRMEVSVTICFLTLCEEAPDPF